MTPGGENGALTIGDGKLLQRALPVRFTAVMYEWFAAQPTDERAELAQLAADVLGDGAQAWLDGLDRLIAAWPKPEPAPQPVPVNVPAGAH